MKKIAILLTTIIWLVSCNQPATQKTKLIDITDQTEYNLLIGTNQAMERAGSMVLDQQGNIYISGNLENSVFFLSLKPDGTLRWAKEWAGRYQSKAFNTLDNIKIGGIANSLSFDGKYLYAIFNTSETDKKNIFSVVIAKISPNNGQLVWIKKWKHKEPKPNTIITTAYNDIAYGIDAHGKYVFVVGTTGDDKVFLLALNKKSGSIFYQKEFELNKLKKDRGFVVRLAEDDNLYITGLSGKTPFLVKIFYPQTEAPDLGWTRKLTMAYPVRINDLVFDEYNNIYVSCYLSGPSTKFIVGKISATQSIIWTKIFPGDLSPNNNSYTVTYHNGNLYAGGSITFRGMNPKQSDGLLVKLDPESGKIIKWAMLRTPNRGEKITNHIIKGISLWKGKLLVFGQVCGNSLNVSDFDARWFTTDSITAKDVEFKITNWDSQVVLKDISTGVISNPAGTYRDLVLRVIDAKDKFITNPPDCDLFLTKFKNF